MEMIVQLTTCLTSKKKKKPNSSENQQQNSMDEFLTAVLGANPQLPFFVQANQGENPVKIAT